MNVLGNLRISRGGRVKSLLHRRSKRFTQALDYIVERSNPRMVLFYDMDGNLHAGDAEKFKILIVTDMPNRTSIEIDVIDRLADDMYFVDVLAISPEKFNTNRNVWYTESFRADREGIRVYEC